jgi:hypothetical protein
MRAPKNDPDNSSTTLDSLIRQYAEKCVRIEILKERMKSYSTNQK